MKKQFLLLTLLLCCTTAWAHDVEVDGIFYNLNEEDKTASVTFKGQSNTEYENEYTGGIVIPETITANGVQYKVTSIGHRSFSNCTDLTSVPIPNSITSLDVYCFEGCTSLTSITIPNSVTIMRGSCFEGCSGLTSITIPNSVTSLGSNCFGGCIALETIKVDENNPVYDSRDNCNAIIRTSNNSLIAGCKTTIIPNTVTNLGSSCFYYCTGLTSITIPNSVTGLASTCFKGCTGLTSIHIPRFVTYIGEECFGRCTSLETITVDEENPVYDSRDNCNAIISTSDNSMIVGCKNTNIPNSVASLQDECFGGCTGLTSINIPNSVTYFGNMCFYKCI